MSAEKFLAGGGELGERIRAYDWSTTPLGPPAAWPQSLKTAVRIMLTSSQPIWLGWGPELTYLYNDPYKSIIGGKHPQALGQPFSEVWREIWDVVGPMADQVMGQDRGIYVEAQLLIMERHGYPEETYYTFSYSPIPDDDGHPGGIICANTDDTRRVIGERQLETLRVLAEKTANAKTRREACEFAMQALAGNARDLPFARIYLRDAGADLWAGAERWPLEEVLGAEETRLVSLDAGTPLSMGAWHRPPAQVALLPVSASGALVVGLNPFRQFDESYRGFLELVRGQVSAAIANAQAYEEERRRADALAELDKAKTAFFSNVSHEFRTPLTLMLGPVEDMLAAQESSLPPEERELLTVVQRNGQRLLKLVNTLLDFARIEAGRVQASYEATDLAALTAGLASNFRSAFERAGLRLEVDCPPAGEPAHVDREMWEKIVLNLLSNAFKFTFEGGLSVTLREEEGFVLRVADTGTGIAPAELPRMFERFHRVDGARGRSHEGSGIGLALVQELVKLHGGSIAVDSEPGRGTTFTVRIPRGTSHLPAERIRPARADATAADRTGAYVDEALSWLPIPEVHAEPRARGQRVLLADDNADLREYARRLLADEYEVEAVGDGIAALAAARARKPDLVVSDVMMPRLDGFGLIAALRADAQLRDVPVILLSARAGEEARVEGLGRGADDYLVKPFSARELLVRVGALLRSVQARRESEDALREEARMLEVLNGVGKTIAGELDIEKTVQAVTDAATQLSGAQFGAFFYNVTNSQGESYMLYALSGARREEFERFGMPRNTEVFAATFGGKGVERLDDVTKDPRYGRMGPHYGMPKGHLPVRAYLAVPVISRVGEVIGGLFFGHSRAGMFTERAERLVSGIAAQAAVAFDNARLYAESRRLVGELQESDRRKDEFIATLSHELRNPLAPLRNSVHLLRLAGADSAAAPRVHEMMERQISHLVRLVDDLLEISRITRGAFELRRERVDLGAVVRHAVETSEPLIREADHRLEVQLPEGKLWVDGDAVRLAQILANLLNNAARYTHKGGEIVLRARREDGQAVVSIRDNGPGIAPADLPRLFEMFGRGSRSSGLGIGLALARRLAEMHGGVLGGASEGAGKGAEFTVRLPLLSDADEPVVAVPAPVAVPPRRRVLIVDDNHDAADSLAMLLRFLGSEVHVVNDGPDAIEAFEQRRPHVVLLDIGMPGMDGYEVARAIRRRANGDGVALVALTGWGQEQDRRRSQEAGFDHHLVKPADIAAIEALLGRLQ